MSANKIFVNNSYAEICTPSFNYCGDSVLEILNGKKKTEKKPLSILIFDVCFLSTALYQETNL